MAADASEPAGDAGKGKLAGRAAILLALLAGGGWVSISEQGREWMKLYLDFQKERESGNVSVPVPPNPPQPPVPSTPAPPPPPGEGTTQVSVQRTSDNQLSVTSTGPITVKVDGQGGVQIAIPAPPPVPPEPPPVPVPPPPPEPSPTPPPSPPPACIAGPFMVFFDWDEDDITPQAAAILDNAASAQRNCGHAAVMIAGHTDRSGPDQYNVGLSQRRTASVRSYLAGRGIADNLMTAEAFGESRPLVETADGTREPQNRRVEVDFGPGPGW